MKMYQLLACALAILLSHDVCTMEIDAQKPLPVKTIRLTAPAKNDLRAQKFHTDSIHVYSSNINILTPGLKTPEECFKCTDLLKSVFFKRLEATRSEIRVINCISIDAIHGLRIREVGQEVIEETPVLLFDKFSFEDLYNLASANQHNNVTQNPTTLSGEKNNYVFVADPLKLCIYFKGINDPVTIHSETSQIDGIETEKPLTLDEFKELKDALGNLYNHGVDINNPHVMQHPTPLDLKTLAVIKNLISD